MTDVHHEHASFDTTCPRCRAPEKLAVVGGTFECDDVPLGADGFLVQNIRTSNEVVQCAACGETFPLDACCLARRGEP